MRGKLKDLFEWCFSKMSLHAWCVFILDSLFVAGSIFLVYSFTNGLSATNMVLWQLIGAVWIYLTFYILGFWLFSTYAGILNNSMSSGLQRVAFAVIIGLSLSIIFRFSIGQWDVFLSISAIELIMSAMIALMLMLTTRMIIKYLFANNQTKTDD